MYEFKGHRTHLKRVLLLSIKQCLSNHQNNLLFNVFLTKNAIHLPTLTMFYKFYDVKEFKRSEYCTFHTNASIENKYTRTRAVFKENNM